MRALHARGPLIQYWGGMGMDSGSRGQGEGGGVGEEINGVGRVSTRGKGRTRPLRVRREKGSSSWDCRWQCGALMAGIREKGIQLASRKRGCLTPLAQFPKPAHP